MRTRPIRALLKTAGWIYSIPCEFDRRYIGETGRLWAVRLGKNRRNLEVGPLERSRLAQHSFEAKYRVLWEEAKILETEQNPMYRKYQEEAYMACLQNPISRTSVVFPPTWLSFIRDELS